MSEISLDSLRDRRLFTTDGRNVGNVVAFEIDPVLWKVRSIVAEVSDTAHDDLDLKKSIIRSNQINIGRELVKSVGDVVNLNVTLDVLKMQLAGPTSKRHVKSKGRGR